MDYSKHSTEHKVKILDYFTMDILNEDGVTFASPDGKLRGNCNICGRSYCGTVRVKSNFITHLRKNHPIQYNEFRIANGKHDIIPVPNFDMDQVEDLRTTNINSTLASSMMPQVEYTTSNGYTISPSGSLTVPSQVVKLGAAVNARVAVKPERQFSNIHQQKRREVLEAMASLITDDMVPTKLFESPRFKQLMNVAGVHDIPAIGDIETHIAMQAETCQENIKDDLMDATHVWLTIQAWTQSTNLSYVTIDAHFLSDWSFRHITCYCHEIDSQDLSKHVGLVKYGLDMLNITHKTTGTITGLTSIISLPTNEVKRQAIPPVNNLDRDVNFKLSGFSLYSLEASLGELVQECLVNCGDETLNLLSKSLTLVKLLDAPILATQRDIDNIAWYKQVELLHKVAKMDAMTKANLKEVTEEDKLLTSNELESLNTILHILTPFKEVAQRIGSTTEISSSLVIPAIKVLQASLQELMNAKHPHQLARELNKHLPKHVQERFMESKALQLSTILDPRFKIQWCSKSEEDDMKSLLLNEVQTVTANVEVAADIKPTVISSSGFFSKILKQEPTVNSDGTKSVEVYRYLDEPIIGEESEPLKYWRSMEEKLPHITKLAKVYLAVPMSSCNVEDLYNCVGQVYSPRSTSLQDDILENVVLVRANNTSNTK